MYMRHYMEVLSHHITIWIGKHYGPHFPMYFVCGYPRSGTTWFSQMLGNYMNLPNPEHYIFPIGFAAIIHTHASANHKLKNCFYIVRDGRDAMVSLYFYTILKMQKGHFPVRQHFIDLFGNDFASNDIKKNLPKFLEDQFSNPIGCPEHWGIHTSMWLDHARNNPNEVVIIRYESLLQNPVVEFKKALSTLLDSIDDDLITEIVKLQDLNLQRKRPEKYHRTYLRKGQSGDWKNYFTYESAEIFNHYAGEALINLGYEDNHKWVSNTIGT